MEIFPFYFIQIFLQSEIKADLWRYQNDITKEREKIKAAGELAEASFTYRSQKEDEAVGTVGGQWAGGQGSWPCYAIN